MFKKLFAAAAVLWCVGAHAQALCFDAAARDHDLDPLLLRAIAQVESNGNARAVNRNANGTVDVGLMQINSIHKRWLRAQGVTRKKLLDEPCTSIHVGASILAQFVNQLGYNWTAVGAYNAGSASNREPARRRYATKVWCVYRDLIEQRRVATLLDSAAPLRAAVPAALGAPSAGAHMR